jgi:hypothetical protein
MMGFTGGFIIGAFVGAAVGIITMCIFQIAGRDRD